MIQVPLLLQVKGFMKLEAINYFSGRKRTLVDWFPNKVLTSGLNRMGTTSDWLNAAQVGTSSTIPQATDTGLLGYIAGTSNVESNTFSAQASPPYYGWRQKTFRFAQGSTAANLSEAGVGWATTSGANLFCRALIIDPQTELPTTVTPLADEILDLTYQLRYYPPLIDWTGTISLNGTVYDIIIRASEVNNASAWGLHIGSTVGVYHGSGSDHYAYDGSLGTLLQSPNGLTDAPSGSGLIYNTGYSNNSLQRDMVVGSSNSGWVLTNGIRSLRFTTTGGRYQAQFTAQGSGNTIPKTILDRMSIYTRITWAEGTVT